MGDLCLPTFGTTNNSTSNHAHSNNTNNTNNSNNNEFIIYNLPQNVQRFNSIPVNLITYSSNENDENLNSTIRHSPFQLITTNQAQQKQHNHSTNLHSNSINSNISINNNQEAANATFNSINKQTSSAVFNIDNALSVSNQNKNSQTNQVSNEKSLKKKAGGSKKKKSMSESSKSDCNHEHLNDLQNSTAIDFVRILYQFKYISNFNNKK